MQRQFRLLMTMTQNNIAASLQLGAITFRDVILYMVVAQELVQQPWILQHANMMRPSRPRKKNSVVVRLMVQHRLVATLFNV
jgi:hypothetical protein